MLRKNNSAKKIFLRLSGKYSIKRVISNHGYGEGVGYFLHDNPNELLYKEELKIHYSNYDYQILAVKEYRYILENNNIVKYFITPENNLFYHLDFIDNSKAIGNHLCDKDQYNATYIFLSSDSFSLNYQILGPQKNYNINTVFSRI